MSKNIEVSEKGQEVLSKTKKLNAWLVAYFCDEEPELVFKIAELLNRFKIEEDSLLFGLMAFKEYLSMHLDSILDSLLTADKGDVEIIF